VTFDTLVDSPMYAGRYFKTYDLDPNGPVPVRLNVVADDAKYLEAKPDHLQAHRNLVQQMYKLYGAHHYDHYDFLFSLSSQMSGNGLEHHRSSENGVGVKYFTSWDPKTGSSDLLAHEFNHSWDGKYRRGADLTTPNFNTPMQGSLLWVYEGQTQYWGNVITARAGLRNVRHREGRAGAGRGRLCRQPPGPVVARAAGHHQRSDHRQAHVEGVSQLAAERGLLLRRPDDLARNRCAPAREERRQASRSMISRASSSA
jgi:uncharacterized protein YciI